MLCLYVLTQSISLGEAKIFRDTVNSRFRGDQADIMPFLYHRFADFHYLEALSSVRRDGRIRNVRNFQLSLSPDRVKPARLSGRRQGTIIRMNRFVVIRAFATIARRTPSGSRNVAFVSADSAAGRFPNAISRLASRLRTAARAFGRSASSGANLSRWDLRYPAALDRLSGSWLEILALPWSIWFLATTSGSTAR